MTVKKKSTVITSAAAALTVAAAVVGSCLIGTLRASAEGFNGDFSKGSYSDAWNGTDYDFSWYTNHENDTEYSISSAAQLAGLSVLTNDLSGEEYSAITQNAQNGTKYKEEYIQEALSFEDKTIKLTADINLGDKDFMPISYPWYTANVTHEKYDALSEIKDKKITPVDSWYGGGEISTRYLDLPESEMRFHDLLYGINFSGEINERTDITAGTVISPEYEDDNTLYEKYIVGKDITSSQAFGSYPGNGGPGFVYDFTLHFNVRGDKDHPDTEYERTRFDDFYGLRDYWGTVGSGTSSSTSFVVDSYPVSKLGNAVSPLSSLKTLDMSTMISSYEYKSIKGSTDNEGFKGTFDGQDHCIIGMHPQTPWTDDTEARLTTYDPLGKGWFGYLAEGGTIQNVNVQGKYIMTLYRTARFCAPTITAR